MSLITKINSELVNALIRAITGELFTEKQVKSITQHAIGKYFADLFPAPEVERKARERVEEAREHIGKASSIIEEMQVDLENQTNQLDLLLIEIDEKKIIAERYAELAETNQEKFAAFRAEMEDALKKELIEQSETGKTLRQIASLIIWIFTLILGAALGTYFKEIIAYIKTIFA